jgi:hypothetical protein
VGEEVEVSRRISVLVLAGLLIAQVPAYAMDAREILQKVGEQTFGETLRVVLSIKTVRAGRTASEHAVWFIGRSDKDGASFFIDFDEPKESRGLRFLLEMRPQQELKAFLYVPGSGKTAQLVVDDPSVDIGGTGLSVDEIQGFLPRKDDNATIVRDEKVGNRDCWVIRVGKTGDRSERLLWVAKEGLVVVKSETVPAQGKGKRTFRVLEFFRTESGKEFPRFEEVTIPDKNLKIEVRQLHGVFGIQLPTEIFDPEKFGTFKWRD